MTRTTKTPSGHTLAPVIQNVTATTTCTSVELARYVSVTSPETQLYSLSLGPTTRYVNPRSVIHASHIAELPRPRPVRLKRIVGEQTTESAGRI